jgi:hypothetical protein
MSCRRLIFPCSKSCSNFAMTPSIACSPVRKPAGSRSGFPLFISMPWPRSVHDQIKLGRRSTGPHHVAVAFKPPAAAAGVAEIYLGV